MSLFKENSFLVWFTVNDWEGAKKFYGKSLGLKTTSESEGIEGWIEYETGTKGAIFAICQSSEGAKGIGGTVCFEVENIDKAVATLKDRNVKFEEKINEIEGHVKIATFYDPSGNRLQLYQLLKGGHKEADSCCGCGH